MRFVVEVVNIPELGRMGSNSLMSTLLFQGAGDQSLFTSLYTSLAQQLPREPMEWRRWAVPVKAHCTWNKTAPCFVDPWIPCQNVPLDVVEDALAVQDYCVRVRVIVEFGFVIIFSFAGAWKRTTVVFSKVTCVARFAEHAPVVSVQDLRARAKNDPPRSQLCPVQRGAPPQRRQQGSPHLPFPPHLLDRLLCKWSAL